MSTVPTNWTDSIGMTVNASYLNNLGTEVNANTAAKSGYGVYSSLPSASSYPGQVYYCSDIDSVYRSNGTTWDLISVAGTTCDSGLADPKTSGLSNTTLGGAATFTGSKGTRLLSITSSATDLRGEYWSVPTAPYTSTFYFDFRVPSGAYSRHGAFLLESSSGKVIMLTLNYQGSFFISSERWNSLTSPGASFVGQFDLGSGTVDGSDNSFPHWFRISDDNTNRKMEISFNGLDWITILSGESRTTFITPNYIGWGGAHTSATSKLRLRSYTLT